MCNVQGWVYIAPFEGFDTSNRPGSIVSASEPVLSHLVNSHLVFLATLRTKHRDCQLLRGDIGHATGSGWSDGYADNLRWTTLAFLLTSAHIQYNEHEDPAPLIRGGGGSAPGDPNCQTPIGPRKHPPHAQIWADP